MLAVITDTSIYTEYATRQLLGSKMVRRMTRVSGHSILHSQGVRCLHLTARASALPEQLEEPVACTQTTELSLPQSHIRPPPPRMRIDVTNTTHTAHIE
jgi:hypothetical protein